MKGLVIDAAGKIVNAIILSENDKPVIPGCTVEMVSEDHPASRGWSRISRGNYQAPPPQVEPSGQDPNAVPESVPMLNFVLQAEKDGILDAMEAYVQKSPRPVKEYWARSDTIRRQHPLVVQGIVAIGKDAAYADAFFRRAAVLVP